MTDEYPGYNPEDEGWEECPCSSPGYPHSPELHGPGVEREQSA
jgi:hypothetical protein